MSKEQTVTTNIKASDNDWEILKNHFPQCFDKNGNFVSIRQNAYCNL